MQRGVLVAVLLAAGSVAPAAARGLDVAWRQEIGDALLAPVVSMQAEVLVATRAGRITRLAASDGSVLEVAEVRGPLVDLVGQAGAAAALTADGRVLGLGWGRAEVERESCLPATASAPALAAGELLLVPLVDSTLAALSLSTGALRWRVPIAGVVKHRPVVSGQRVLVVAQSGAVALLSLADGRVEARGRIPPASGMAAGLLSELALVGGSGQKLVALDARKGSRRWQAEIGRGPSAPIVQAGDRALVATNANQLLLLKPNGTPLWRLALPARLRAEPLLVQDVVWLVPERLGQLLGIDIASGTERASFALGGAWSWFVGPPVVSAGQLVLATSRGELIALEAATGAPPGPQAESSGLPVGVRAPGASPVPPTAQR